MRLLKINLLVVAVLFLVATAANAYQIILTSDYDFNPVTQSDYITMQVWLDTQGESNIKIISVGIEFDPATISYERQLSSASSYILYSPANASTPISLMYPFVSTPGGVQLRVHEQSPGAYDRSPRLQEIAGRYRETMPVHVTDAHDVLDADRPFRVLLPGGEEQRIAGDRIRILRAGQAPEERRLPWLERVVRRASLALKGWRLRRLQRVGTPLSRRLARERGLDRQPPRTPPARSRTGA